MNDKGSVRASHRPPPSILVAPTAAKKVLVYSRAARTPIWVSTLYWAEL